MAIKYQVSDLFSFMTISSFHVRVTNQICSHRRTKIIILLSISNFSAQYKINDPNLSSHLTKFANLEVWHFTLGSSNLSNCFDIFQMGSLYLEHFTNVLCNI